MDTTNDTIETLDEDATWQQKLGFALQQNASVEVISWITGHMADPGLPWIHILLEHGYAREQVRQMVAEHCEHEYFGLEFQGAFLAGYEAWNIFDDQDLANFLKKLAEQSCNAEQIILQSDDHHQELMQRLGNQGLYQVMEVAVGHLERLRHSRTLATLRKLEIQLQRLAAKRLYPDWNSIPFIVEVMSIPFQRQERRSELAFYGGKLLPHENWPLQTPMALRWAMLGGLHVPAEDGWAQEGDLGKQLRGAVEARGWRFAKLERITDPTTGKLALGVIDNSRRGQTLIFMHNQNGERGDQLKVGDEVMIPTDPTKLLTNGPHIHAVKKLAPVRKDGQIQVFKYELHPVAPPTNVMLERPDFYFRGDDIVSPK